MKFILTILMTACSIILAAQNKPLPYAEIPAHPDYFTAGGVAARLIDGLGFRYYWATESLREVDLAFKPGNDARTCEETLAHIYEMSIMIANSATKKVNQEGQDVKLSFMEMRKQTLLNFKLASDQFRTVADADMKDYKVMFKTPKGNIEYPFWNQINGPISDCIWHIGQIVSFRRSSGNPISDNIGFFEGNITK